MLACFIVILAAVGPFIGWWAASRLGEALIARDASRGLCAACGYDRAGLEPTDQCPECGLDSSAARAGLDRRRWLCSAVIVGVACALSLLYVVLAQPLTPGEEAWGCAGIWTPLCLLAVLGVVPRAGRRGWLVWTLTGPALLINLVLIVPAYLDLALNQRPGPYGRGFSLQIVPLMVGVIGVGVSGWGVAGTAWFIALSERVRLRRPRQIDWQADAAGNLAPRPVDQSGPAARRKPG